MRLNRLPLRWRVAALTGLAIAVLGVVGTFTAYLVVRTTLRSDLQRGLRVDARTVAELYSSGQPGRARDTLSGPTGGVIVQLYDLSGALLVASAPGFDEPEALIPADVVRDAARGGRDWEGELAGKAVQAALAPFGVGVAAVLADTEYIGSALQQLARALLLTAALLVLLSALAGYLIAGAALDPLRHLALQADRLGPNRLEPIRYRGPRDELGLLSGALNDLIARLKESFDAQRQFLLETSHELRTPLTSLQGFLDRALRRAPPEVEGELRDARRIAGTMSRLVEDLLQLSRGQVVQELVPHIVDPYLEVLEPVAEEFPGVRLAGEPGHLLLGDQERLRQLLRNLVANGVRATGDPAAVALALSATGGELAITVSDSGPGIPADQQERIFEKFYRGVGGGAGLGLAIARQIAEQHGGTIRLESRPGATRFTITLPAVDASD